MKLCYLKDSLETNTLVDCQNASIVLTLFNLLTVRQAQIREGCGTEVVALAPGPSDHTDKLPIQL